MASRPHIRLLDADPELARLLSPEERAEAQGLILPVLMVARGDVDLDTILDGRQAFGAVVLEGMLQRSVVVGGRTAIRLLGPGDLIAVGQAERSDLIEQAGCTATSETSLALLDGQLMIAIRRWPRLVAGLYARLGDQAERLASQLAICQLPRVTDRVLSILWLLAETWGRVTPAGVTLPLNITHDAIGSLVGARRPTVTLALRELAEQGAVLRQDRGWLLLSRPEPSGAEASAFEPPRILDSPDRVWAERQGEGAADRPELAFAEIRETVERMRAEVELSRERVRDRLMQSRRTRERVLRRRRMRAQIRSRQPPSS